MATTNFYGWSEPDNSSLVKNGAQDIRILGDAIDASVWNIGFGQAGKNKIINGDFGIWQRGGTFTNPLDSTYNADRWMIEHDGTGATRTISQQTFTPGAAPVAGYESQFFLRYTVSGGTSNTYQQIEQRVEDVRILAGNTVTLSFWAKADAARTISILYRRSYGSGGSTAEQTSVGSAINITTSWVRYSVTTTVASLSGKTLGAGSFTQWILRFAAATAQTIDIWGVQLEYGSTATPFETASGSIQGELAMCQRYYQAISTTPSGVMVYGGSSSGGFSANAYSNFTFPVQMRTTPTITFYAHDGTAGAVSLYVASTAIKSTSVASIGASPWGWSGNFTSATWGTNADSGLLAYGYKAEAEL